MKRCPSQDHTNLICPLRFVTPLFRYIIPDVCPTGKPYNPIVVLPPHFIPEIQFIRSQHHNVIIDGQYGFGFDVFVGEEPIGQFVGFCLNDFQWLGDFREVID